MSRDVVFDENVFPFASLHPNAGAQLRAELSFLPDILLNPETSSGDAQIRGQHDEFPIPTNASSMPVEAMLDAGEDSAEFGDQNSSSGRHFMCPPAGGNTCRGANPRGDSSAAPAGLRIGAPSGSAPGSAPVSPSGAGVGVPAGSSTAERQLDAANSSRAVAQPDLDSGGAVSALGIQRRIRCGRC